MGDMWIGLRDGVPMVDETGTVRVVIARDAGQARWLLGGFDANLEAVRIEVTPDSVCTLDEVPND